ncbi:hypothetical protein BS50DRAFT_593343 [Corynespora cassiicola Philippines]|uniref:Uncharacterized protein n=1 Tax=Corynespora cassiicola Philippines TaxID=1448308 RepID=A0A2T2N7J3_CORCC|nr:hypothetical protein BS50DRAFT_593343 [Corynespora cassiicola Philippines]
MDGTERKLSNGEDYDLIQISDEIRREAMEASLLRERISSLQQQMLASVERYQAIPDEQLTQDFRNLSASVKSLSRNVSPASLDHIDAMFNDCSLLQGAPHPQQALKSRKKIKLEAALWSVLIETVFKTPFTSFSYLGEDLFTTWSSMFDNHHSHLWPSPTKASEVWRYTTMEHLIRKSGISPGGTWLQRSEHGDVKTHATIREAANKTFSHLDQTLKAFFHTGCLDQIDTVIKKAFNLAMRIYTQRSRIQVVYPHVGKSYLAGMENNLVPIPECEDCQIGSVSATINPGLAK